MRRLRVGPRFMVMLALVLAMSLLAVPATGSQTGADSADDDFLIVELSSAPLAHNDETKENGRFDPSSRAYQQALQRLEREHQRFIDRLARTAPEAEVVYQAFLTANSVTIDLGGASVSDVARVPGVQKTHAPTLYQLHMDTSLPLIGAHDGTSNTAPPNAGAGVKVGVIDSGVDPNHPFFDCKDIHYGGVFYSGVGILPGVPALPAIFGPGFIPEPDHPVVGSEFYASDPHGTHVAGTVGGCVTTVADGGLFDGSVVSGVAPAAEIHDYNVFPFFGAGMVAFGGSAFSHDIAAAIEKAVSDGMHVINMSLGGGVQGPNDYLVQVSNNAVEAGVVVVASAGNEGPGPYTVGSPGVAEQVIAVGASTNSRTAGVSVEVPNGNDLDVYEGFSAEWGDFDGSAYPLEDWSGSDNLACTAAGAGDQSGKIVLIARGSCTFSEKIASAEAANAAGAIIYSDDRDPGGMAGEGSIPAVMISNEAGLQLETRLEAEGTIEGVVVTPPTITSVTPNLMAGFSSRGPAPFTGNVKPDVVAPGVDILSSVWEFGGLFGFGIGEPGWELYGGTSMAAPHVAGAAAVLLASDGDLTPAEVKSRFVNTGTLLVDAESEPYTVWEQGGGLVSLPTAIGAAVTFEPASVSFGGWQGKKPVNGSMEVAIAGGSCTVEDITGSGSAFVEATPTSAGLTVSFEGGRDAPSGMHGGHVVLDCGGDSHHIPWGIVINR